MSTLFAGTYKETDHGRATRLLAGVAEIVELHLGSRMDEETRIGCMIDLHRIERDDLPEDQRSLCDELRAYFGIE
ncbi:MAG: hypothetical protein ABFE07_06575 [Armatimonadia bacterium]